MLSDLSLCGLMRKSVFMLVSALLVFVCPRIRAAEDIKTTIHFVEEHPSAAFTDLVKEKFAEAYFVRFKYAPPGTEEGRVSQSNIAAKWLYSVTENCHGPCNHTISKVGARILTARRVDRDCPGPYVFVLELLDAKEAVIDGFSFGVGGVCFAFHGMFYSVLPSDSLGGALDSTPFEAIFQYDN